LIVATFNSIHTNFKFRKSIFSPCFFLFQGIQTELEKLKADMLKKIEDIHNLELELVKIEGQNYQMQSSNNKNTKTILSSQRNEEVMAEIRSMLREMVNSEASMNPGAHNLTVNKIYEEYSKIIGRDVNAHQQITTETHHFNPSHHSESRTNNINNHSQMRRSADIIENVENSDIYERFNVYRSKIEQEFVYLVNHSKDLEANLNNIDNLDRAIKEIDKFKNLIRLAENNFNKEKSYLFKQIDNFLSINNSNSNRVVINNTKANIEKILADKHIEFQTIINGLYSSLSQTSSRLNGGAKTSDSSFLTEEEEAIKKISERIKVLKARIDSKDRTSKPAKRLHAKKSQRRVNGGSCENVSQSSSDDTDNKELQHLNEHIKLLKSRMIAKGDQLNMMKKSSTDVFQQTAATAHVSSHMPVYMPINFTRASGQPFEITASNGAFVQSGEQFQTYRVEPLELYEDGGACSQFSRSNTYTDGAFYPGQQMRGMDTGEESTNEQNEYTRTSYRDIINQNLYPNPNQVINFFIECKVNFSLRLLYLIKLGLLKVF
jgi:hypothetical protein